MRIVRVSVSDSPSRRTARYRESCRPSGAVYHAANSTCRAAAIARILQDKKKHIEKSIEEAERMLRFGMDDAGCPSDLALDKLYRDSRVVKPPATWDKEILDSFTIWLKQSGRTPKPKRDEDEGPKGGLGEKLSSLVKQVKDQVARVQTKTGKKKKHSKFAILNR
jgi:hypothetical protein